MTVYKIRYIAVILFIVSPFVVLAQQQNTDSISIFELMDAVEKNTSCRIYTTIATPFKVKKSETSKPTAETGTSVVSASPCPLPSLSTKKVRSCTYSPRIVKPITTD